jgi:hypothetical protein
MYRDPLTAIYPPSRQIDPITTIHGGIPPGGVPCTVIVLGVGCLTTSHTQFVTQLPPQTASPRTPRTRPSPASRSSPQPASLQGLSWEVNENAGGRTHGHARPPPHTWRDSWNATFGQAACQILSSRYPPPISAVPSPFHAPLQRDFHGL